MRLTVNGSSTLVFGLDDIDAHVRNHAIAVSELTVVCSEFGIIYKRSYPNTAEYVNQAISDALEALEALGGEL